MALALQAAHAFADPTSGSDTAEELFRWGRAWMAAGRITEACVTFEESIALEPAIGAFLNLGRCYEMSERPASALAAYEEASQRARAVGALERARLAERQIERIRSKVSTILPRFPENEEIESVRIGRRQLTSAQWKAPIAVDPSRYRIEVTRRGDPHPHSVHVLVPKAAPEAPPSVITVVISFPSEELDNIPPSTGTTPTPVATKAPKSSEPMEVPAQTKNQALRTTAWIGVLLGTVATATGAILLVDAVNRAKGSDCDEDLKCSLEGLRTRADARTELSAGYSVGGAGLFIGVLSGITLLSTQPTVSQKIQTSIVGGPGGAHLSMGFQF